MSFGIGTLSLSNDHWIKNVISGSSQYDAFELSRGSKDYRSMDPYWLSQLDERVRRKLESVGEWGQYSSLLKQVNMFSVEKMLGITNQERIKWIQEGKGVISQWMSWTEANREFIEQSMMVKSFSRFQRQEARTYRSKEVGVVRARGEVSFDAFISLEKPLSIFFDVQRARDESLPQWEASLRNLWFLWYEEFHGLSFFVTKREKYLNARRNHWIRQRLFDMKYVEEFNSSRLDSYIRASQRVDFLGEVRQMWISYLDHLPQGLVFQYLVMVTSQGRSVEDMRVQLYQATGNLFLATYDLIEDGSDTQLQMRDRLMDDGESTIVQLQPLEKYRWKKVEIEVDLLAALYYFVQVPDVEKIVMGYHQEVCNRQISTVTTGEAYAPRDIHLFPPQGVGEPLVVSQKMMEWESLTGIVPQGLTFVFASSPIVRVMISSGLPVWKDILSGQPAKMITFYGNKMFAFSVDEVRDNIHVIVQMESGFGYFSSGEFPMHPGLVTDAWDGSRLVLPDGKRYITQGAIEYAVSCGYWSRKQKNGSLQLMVMDPPHWVMSSRRKPRYVVSPWDSVLGEIVPIVKWSLRYMGFESRLQYTRGGTSYGEYPFNRMKPWWQADRDHYANLAAEACDQ